MSLTQITNKPPNGDSQDQSVDHALAQCSDKGKKRSGKRPEPIVVPKTSQPTGPASSSLKAAHNPRLTPMTATTPSVAVFGNDFFKCSIGTPGQFGFYYSPRNAAFPRPLLSSRQSTFRSVSSTPLKETSNELQQVKEDKQGEYDGNNASITTTTTTNSNNNNSDSSNNNMAFPMPEQFPPGESEELEVRINPQNMISQNYDSGDRIVFFHNNLSIVFDSSMQEPVKISTPTESAAPGELEMVPSHATISAIDSGIQTINSTNLQPRSFSVMTQTEPTMFQPGHHDHMFDSAQDLVGIPSMPPSQDIAAHHHHTLPGAAPPTPPPQADHDQMAVESKDGAEDDDNEYDECIKEVEYERRVASYEEMLTQEQIEEYRAHRETLEQDDLRRTFPPPVVTKTEGLLDPAKSEPGSIVYTLAQNMRVWDKVVRAKKGVYRCNHCELRFNTLLFFSHHMDTQQLKRGFPCEVRDCPWSCIGFTKRSEWSRHMKHQHDNQSRFQCRFDACGKCFSRKDSMKRHYLLVHENSASRRNKKLQMLAQKEKRRQNRRAVDSD